MKLSQALILAIDTETTGTNVHEDRIVELGGAYLQGGKEVGQDYRRWLIRSDIFPQARVPYGIRDQDVEDAPTW